MPAPEDGPGWLGRLRGAVDAGSAAPETLSVVRDGVVESYLWGGKPFSMRTMSLPAEQQEPCPSYFFLLASMRVQISRLRARQAARASHWPLISLTSSYW